MFGRSKDKESNQETPREEPKTFSRSEEISNNYRQLGECCELLSAIKREPDELHVFMMLDYGGWKVTQRKLEAAGINMDDIYTLIETLTRDRKAELEDGLQRIEKL